MSKEKGIFLGTTKLKEPVVFEEYSRENSKNDLRLGTLGEGVSINTDESNTLEELKSIRGENIEKVLAKAVEIMKIEDNYAFDIEPSSFKTKISIYQLITGERKVELELDLIGSQIGVVDCKYIGQVMEEDLREFSKEGVI